MSRVDVDRRSKRYGSVARAGRRSPSISPMANSSGCSALAAAARRRCCAPSPVSSIPDDGDDCHRRRPGRARRRSKSRGIGMVFQNYALFPHMTVADNVAFGLDVRACARSEREPAASRAARPGAARRLWRPPSAPALRRPAAARGAGPRARHQARACCCWTSRSARSTRAAQDMQVELKQIQREIGITTIFVTHDQEEALTIPTASPSSMRAGWSRSERLSRPMNGPRAYLPPSSLAMPMSSAAWW